MSAPRWRWSLIGLWLFLTCVTFIGMETLTARAWAVLFLVGLIPPLMLVWFWNEDRPLLLGSLRGRHNQL